VHGLIEKAFHKMEDRVTWRSCKVVVRCPEKLMRVAASGLMAGADNVSYERYKCRGVTGRK